MNRLRTVWRLLESCPLIRGRLARNLKARLPSMWRKHSWVQIVCDLRSDARRESVWQIHSQDPGWPDAQRNEGHVLRQCCFDFSTETLFFGEDIFLWETLCPINMFMTSFQKTLLKQKDVFGEHFEREMFRIVTIWNIQDHHNKQSCKHLGKYEQPGHMI